MKVLIASPVRQQPDILKLFLVSLGGLRMQGFEYGYYFADDNTEAASSSLLEKFAAGENDVFIKKTAGAEEYLCDEQTHHWNGGLIEKVAALKNEMLVYSVQNGYDRIFLVDSDLVLQPATLMQLIKAEKDIIAEIYWTRWEKDGESLPQVWLYDNYKMSDPSFKEQAAEKGKDFIAMLKKPGIYKVGGLGACTLISSQAVKKGVSFSRIGNISYPGEDRHFCIRAVVLGFELFVDTHYPALHIYRREDMGSIRAWVEKSMRPQPEKPPVGAER